MVAMYRSRKLMRQYSPDKSRDGLKKGTQECPFCSLEDRVIVRNGKTMVVLENIYGYKLWEFMDVENHLMITPKRHVKAIHELNKQEKAELIELIAEYEKLGYNIYAREESNVIKSVPHQHTHLIKTKNNRAKFYMYIRSPYFIFKA